MAAYVDRRARQEERRARRSAVTDPDIVMAAAAALLATRSRTTREMRDRLATLGYPGALVDQTVERLVGLGYLDDAAFAQAWIASRDRSRPRGSVALRQELLRKGLDRDLIDAALATRGRADRAPNLGPVAASDASADAPASTDRAPATADHAAASRLLERRRASLLRGGDPRKAQQRAFALLARNGFDPAICATVARTLVADPGEDEPEPV